MIVGVSSIINLEILGTAELLRFNKTTIINEFGKSNESLVHRKFSLSN